MDLKSYLQTLYEYNYWANHRYLKAAGGLTGEQFTRKQGHSWDSVRGVLVHMMSSERMWPMRWKGAGILGGRREGHEGVREGAERGNAPEGGHVHESPGRNLHPAPVADDGARAQP
jgi:uncharacterized damage-inducible protein DinB